MTKYLDARFLGDKETAHNYLAEQFDFPDYYGNNLDALYDCLTDLGDPEDIPVVITHADDLDSSEAITCYEKFFQVLCEACEVTVSDSTEE